MMTFWATFLALLLPLRLLPALPETADAPFALLYYDVGSDLTVVDARGKPVDFSYGPATDGAGTLLLFPEKPQELVTIWRNGLPGDKTAAHAAQLDFGEVYTYKLTGVGATPMTTSPGSSSRM